ncbi:phosphoglycolate phosphatase [Paenibacillus anaericanus]|uniref:HAD family hydrolase n=1 Tax=Paenibacillus anaericanus TaxID=170367 RepID=UPI002780B965|nr:HAD family hydrolase [Paenibacillus anaericanus]MDQ0088761.1 phosphoglycolate phosphatase [Paenibacillus anaericanus]
MERHINNILFDLDGTLTDPKEGITKCVEYALNKFDIQVDHIDQLIPYIGPPLYESFVELGGLSPENAHLAVDYYRERFREVGMFENSVIPGFPELLQFFQDEGYTLYVATSKPTVFAEQILKHFEMDHYFKHIVGSNLDGTRTKKQEVIQFVLDENIISPESAIMIGDREHDIIGAKGCGVESIGVLFGYGSEEELRNAGADHIVGKVDEIREIILNIGNGDYSYGNTK